MRSKSQRKQSKQREYLQLTNTKTKKTPENKKVPIVFKSTTYKKQ